MIKSDREGPADLRRQIEDEEVQLSKACLAAKAGDVEALRSMDKDELASTSEGDPAASQAVRYAAAFDRVECVRELHVGMDIDMTVPCDGPGNTPAFWAASCGSATVLEALYTDCGVDMAVKCTKAGHMPVQCAVRHNQDRCLRVLHTVCGVDIMGPCDRSGNTLAYYAVHSDAASCLVELGRLGVDLAGPCDKKGFTPACCAICFGSMACLRALGDEGGVDLQALAGKVSRTWRNNVCVLCWWWCVEPSCTHMRNAFSGTLSINIASQSFSCYTPLHLPPTSLYLLEISSKGEPCVLGGGEGQP